MWNKYSCKGGMMKYPTKNEKMKPKAISWALTEKIAKIIGGGKGMAVQLSNYLQNHRERIAFDIDYALERIPRDHTILDVGASPFLLSGALSDAGYDLTALDCGPENLKDVLLRLGLKTMKCNIETEKIPASDHFFNDVILNEVFEHLRINPIFTLNEIRRVLKPGGRLWISTPNMRSFNGFYNLIITQKSFSCSGDIYSQYENCHLLGGMGHVREYTALEVCEFLEKIGFKIEEIIYRGKYRMRIKKWIPFFLPSLRPFMTIIASKKD